MASHENEDTNRGETLQPVAVQAVGSRVRQILNNPTVLSQVEYDAAKVQAADILSILPMDAYYSIVENLGRRAPGGPKYAIFIAAPRPGCLPDCPACHDEMMLAHGLVPVTVAKDEA